MHTITHLLPLFCKPRGVGNQKTAKATREILQNPIVTESALLPSSVNVVDDSVQ